MTESISVLEQLTKKLLLVLNFCNFLTLIYLQKRESDSSGINLIGICATDGPLVYYVN